MKMKLGFGEVECCLEGIGIACSGCRYRDACMEEEDEVAYLEGLI